MSSPTAGRPSDFPNLPIGAYMVREAKLLPFQQASLDEALRRERQIQVEDASSVAGFSGGVAMRSTEPDGAMQEATSIRG